MHHNHQESSRAKRPVVFLDRDGTLNEEIGYIRQAEKLVLIEGAAEAIYRLNQAGIAAVLVTNQTGAARGYYPVSHIEALNQRLADLLQAQHASLDAMYYCPHYAQGTVAEFSIDCQCRKPEIGMVEMAYRDHPDLDRLRSFVIGDKATDVELARNCGAKAVLVQTGYGRKVLDGQYQWKVQPDYTAADICEAVDWIISSLQPAPHTPVA